MPMSWHTQLRALADVPLEGKSVATRITDLRGVEGGYAALDDRLLVLDFQAGHPEAFVEIHRRYGGLARHVCARYLPNPADADEAFQGAGVRVFQRGREGAGW